MKVSISHHCLCMPLLIDVWPNWRFISLSKGKGAKQACGKITAEGRVWCSVRCWRRWRFERLCLWRLIFIDNKF
jgi:hypothetical protein